MSSAQWGILRRAAADPADAVGGPRGEQGGVNKGGAGGRGRVEVSGDSGTLLERGICAT